MSVIVRLAGMVLVLVSASAVTAETIELPKTAVKLAVPDGWTAVKAPGVVAAYKTTSGAALAVTRADIPNPDAWKPETKAAYADKVERGIKAGIPGYKRASRTLADVNGVPALDVEATRDGGATVIVRVILFRTYALSLAVEVPKGGDVAPARAIVQAFAPPPPAIAPSPGSPTSNVTTAQTKVTVVPANATKPTVAPTKPTSQTKAATR